MTALFCNLDFFENQFFVMPFAGFRSGIVVWQY